MPLTRTPEQIRELVKANKGKGHRAKALSHEARLRLHSEGALSQNEAASTALNDFLLWWERNLASPDKFPAFLNMLTWPLPTVGFTVEVWKALEKVFDGRNPVQQYDFTLPELLDDAQEYIEAKELQTFFRKRIFDTAKEGYINQLMVVDLPPQQETEYPEPYVWLLEIEDVISYKYEGGKFEWVAFEVEQGEKELIAFFDAEAYRLFEKKDGTVGNLVSEAPHDLGYTPVQFMWWDTICTDDEDLKESPLTPYLGDLDWLLGYKISKRLNEMTANYPVYWMYDVACDYSLSTTNGVIEQCHGGFLKNGQGQWLLNTNRNAGANALQPCPVCAKSRLVGPGTTIYKPFPSDGQTDVGAPVGVLPAETNSLEYNTKEIERLESKVFTAVTGAGKAPINDQAVNEKQVGAIVDAQANTLKALKGNLERAQKWALETIFRLRYAGDFLGATVNLGEEFHLVTAADLRLRYEEARRNGESAQSLDRLWEDYITTRYRHDPVMLQREKVLMHLDPFRHRTANEVGVLEYVPLEMKYFKFNFSSLLMRFERENGDILNFGSAISFDKRIEAIKNTLIEYAKELTGTFRPTPEPSPTS